MGHKIEQIKFVFGSSNIVKLESDSFVPGNFGMQIKTGSIAFEKNKRSGKNNQKLKILNLQDGTKNISEICKRADENFKDLKTLFDECRHKFDNNHIILIQKYRFEEPDFK